MRFTPTPTGGTFPHGRDRSIAAHRRGHVGQVALGVGQRPPGGRVVVGAETAACRDRGGDPCLGLVGGHPDVEVDPVGLRTGDSIFWYQTAAPRPRGSTRSSGLSSRSWYPSTAR